MEKSSPEKQQKGSDTIETKYMIPVKEIKNPMFMGKFLKGKCYINIMQFISNLQRSVKGKAISATGENPKFKKMLAF